MLCFRRKRGDLQTTNQVEISFCWKTELGTRVIGAGLLILPNIDKSTDFDGDQLGKVVPEPTVMADGLAEDFKCPKPW